MQLRRRSGGEQEGMPTVVKEAWERTRSCPGQHDPYARLADMDADGVAVDVIFSGGRGRQAASRPSR